MKFSILPIWLRFAIACSAGLFVLVLFTARIAEHRTLAPTIPSTSTDIHVLIAKAVSEGMSVEAVANLSDTFTTELSPILTLPNWPNAWIDARKQGTVFRLGDLLFVSVLQPSMDIPFYPNNEADLGPTGSWAGLLVSPHGGTHLHPTALAPWFEVRNEDPTVPHNVVGLFTAKKTLFVDVVDAHGAGSGEGLVTRLSSQDGGKTWKPVGCFYFIPKAYHTMHGSEDSAVYGFPLRPNALAPTSSCQYRHNS